MAGRPPTKRPQTKSGGRPSASRDSSGAKSKRAGQRPEQILAAKRQRAEQARREKRRKLWIRTAVATGAAVVILLIIFLTGGNSPGSSYTYAVGTPGPGTTAPTFQLPSTAGGSFNLADEQGKTTLLYFQEGTDCEPCWTQMKTIQADMAKFRALGIDKVVSITTNPLGALQQKAADEGVTFPILSDSNLTVSHAYNANQYGMMGTMMDGHSFVVIGPTGSIEWRADYGGSPNYTMNVPDATLLKQMRTGMAHASGT